MESEYPKVISPNGVKAPYVLYKNEEYEKGGFFTIIGERELPIEEIPSHAETWEGRGYTGGHMSQSKWDDSQEFTFMKRKILDGFYVRDLTRTGSTSGYYPKVAYWK